MYTTTLTAVWKQLLSSKPLVFLPFKKISLTTIKFAPRSKNNALNFRPKNSIKQLNKTPLLRPFLPPS